jgi:hypothetical protein
MTPREDDDLYWATPAVDINDELREFLRVLSSAVVAMYTEISSARSWESSLQSPREHRTPLR